MEHASYSLHVTFPCIIFPMHHIPHTPHSPRTTFPCIILPTHHNPNIDLSQSPHTTLPCIIMATPISKQSHGTAFSDEPLADPGEGGQGGHDTLCPVKISHEKDGRQRRTHRFHVSCPPPLTRPLHPLLQSLLGNST